MKIKHKFHKQPALLAVLLTILITIFACAGGKAYAAAAPTYGANFENTNVLDDLNGATIAGKPFDIKDYPINEAEQPQMLTFVEYCYDGNGNQANYGLYVYIYNPTGKSFETSSKMNRIQLSVGSEQGYKRYPLLYLNGTTDGRFYKYKISFTSEELLSVLKALSANERQYRISGFTLLPQSAVTAVEYVVGKEYTYVGFSANYGTTESTLQVTDKFLETVTLDVHHTTFRTPTSNKGPYYQKQLDSVYFAVPNRLFKEYGRLQRILAEWYEYRTQPICVTSNADFYAQVLPYMGKYIPDYTYDSTVFYGLISTMKSTALQKPQDFWNLVVYNYCLNYAQLLNFFNLPTNLNITYQTINTLFYLFYTPESINNYDPYTSTRVQGGIEGSDLERYILNYAGADGGGTFDYLPVKDGKRIRACLFEKDIDKDRKVADERGRVDFGYSFYDFDADIDTQLLTGYKPNNHSFKDNVQMYGLWKALFKNYGDEQSYEVPPIQILTANDVAGAAETVSKSLLVGVDDVENLQAFQKSAESEDKSVVLFRFATSDYYSQKMEISNNKAPTPAADHTIDGQAYICQTEVFMDFKTIQLTFNKDGSTYVIPVVQSPIDLYPDITPAPDRGGTDIFANFFKNAGKNLITGLIVTAVIAGTILLIILIAVIAKRVQESRAASYTAKTAKLNYKTQKLKSKRKKK